MMKNELIIDKNINSSFSEKSPYSSFCAVMRLTSSNFLSLSVTKDLL